MLFPYYCSSRRFTYSKGHLVITAATDALFTISAQGELPEVKGFCHFFQMPRFMVLGLLGVVREFLELCTFEPCLGSSDQDASSIRGPCRRPDSRSSHVVTRR